MWNFAGIIIDTNTLNVLVSVFQALIALISLLLASAALQLSIRARRVLSTADQLSNIVPLFNDTYQFRQFPQQLVIERNKVINLKEARVYVKKALAPKNNESVEQAREKLLSRTLILPSWENTFAYEVSLGLEIVGASVLAGAIPLSFVLGSNALQIVDDWLLCERLVNEKIRQQPEAVHLIDVSLQGEIRMQRIHGEWLAYASALWLSRSWSGGILDQFIDKAGGKKMLEKSEKRLRQHSLGLMTDDTERAITRMLHS